MARFDALMSAREQKQWIEDYCPGQPTPRMLSEARPENHLGRVIRLIEHPAGDTIIRVLREYVWRALPAPLASEMQYWTCSCFPGASLSGEIDFALINVNWQEVLTAYQRDGHLMFSVYFARSPLIAVFGEELTGLARTFPAIHAMSPGLKPGGSDQVHVSTRDPLTVYALLTHRDILTAIRLFNLRLMRRGRCPYAKGHNFFLADRLLDSPVAVAGNVW